MRTLRLIILSAVAGGLGGLAGAVISYWLCITIGFGIFPPWGELPDAVRDSNLIILLFSLLGFVGGGFCSALCLRFWVVGVGEHPELNFNLYLNRNRKTSSDITRSGGKPSLIAYGYIV